jgi:hypothetical protein
MYNGMYQRIVRYLRRWWHPPTCEACGGTTLLLQYSTDGYVCTACVGKLGYFEYMQP